MPRWEVCRIKEVIRHESGVFNERRFDKYVVVLDSVQGEVVIHQSPEVERPKWDDYNKNRQFEQVMENNHSVLVGKLLSDGWEPIQLGGKGVFAFSRQVM